MPYQLIYYVISAYNKINSSEIHGNCLSVSSALREQ